MAIAELRRLTAWFWDDAVPLWAERAWDRLRGGFYESLDFNADPVADEPRRVRVQSRQIHTFAMIARLKGDARAAELAQLGFRRLLKTACPEGGARGCGHVLSYDGICLDARRDLYDQAFLLLACASIWEAFRDHEALAIAERATAFLDRELKAPEGYWEDDARALPRRQNPHMHLFEAMLALHRASGEPAYLERAAALEKLFRTRFLDRRARVLREYFVEDLTAADPAKGDIIEPGHMMEWVWLLEGYAERSGRDAAETQTLLFERAIELGEDDGFLVDRRRLGAQQASGSRRLWPQTEYLKASLVLARRGDAQAEDRARKLVRALFDSYLDQPVKGLWCDEYEADRCIARAVPASILYHLLGAALEAERYLEVRA